MKATKAVAEKATKAVAEKATKAVAGKLVTVGQLFDEPNEPFAPDALGPRLLCFDSYASSDVKRWWDLANASYNQLDPGEIGTDAERNLYKPWAQIGADAERNLKLIALAVDGRIELGFRGSVFTDDSGKRQLANWHRINADVVPVPLSPEFGMEAPESTLVHKGFQDAYLRLRPQLLTWLEGQGGVSSVKRCVIVGHSLGGAMATLCAADLGNLGVPTELITWGGPRVGNAGFVELYHRSAPSGRHGTTARFVNGLDIVPRSQQPGFRHVCPPSMLHARDPAGDGATTADELAALTELTAEAGELTVEDNNAAGEEGNVAEHDLSGKAGNWLRGKAEAAGKQVGLAKEAAAKQVGLATEVAAKGVALAKKTVTIRAIEDHRMGSHEKQLKLFEGRA
jgi:hypothetical protein